MWALLSTRLRTWVFLSIALPLAAALSRRLADRLEQRAGAPTTATRALRRVGSIRGGGAGAATNGGRRGRR